MGYRSEFEAAGIRHCDLYFDDCTVPDDDTVRTSPSRCRAVREARADPSRIVFDSTLVRARSFL